jgi:enterochelin esterase-like enzyme
MTPLFAALSAAFLAPVSALKKKGYDVTYTEVPGGVHAPETWKTRLPDGIAALSRPRG